MSKAKETNNKFSKRQIVAVIIVACVHFFSAVCISIQAPFYPQEAEKKGATATEYGLVFGVFELIAFLTSPLFGKIVNNLGAKLLLTIGMMSSGIAICLFGALDFVYNHYWFITLSFVLRIIESLGSTAAVVAAFSLTGSMFPDSVATVFATLEVFYGVGFIIGPTLGGILYNIGGFVLPFAFTGAITVLVALCILLFLPDLSDKKREFHNKSKLWEILKIVPILINSAGTAAVSSSSGFYNATLEPHLREYHLSPVSVGLIFVISGGTYAVVAPIYGRIIDKYCRPTTILFWGCVFNIISFSLVGPLPFLPIPKTLIVIIVALVIHGLALGAINVATFIDSIRTAIECGYPNDLSTYGLISGLWASSFALGAFIGPSIAGFLYDEVGFQKATLFVIITHVLLLIWISFFIKGKRVERKLNWDLSQNQNNSSIDLTESRKSTDCLLRHSYPDLANGSRILSESYGAVNVKV